LSHHHTISLHAPGVTKPTGHCRAADVVIKFVSPPIHQVTHATPPYRLRNLPIPEFCAVTGLGKTLVRAMIADGRLQSYRAGKKKLLVVVQSYLDLIAKQQADGVPEYDTAQKARAVRKANLEARRTAAPADPTLEDLGL
jgi:hypothetical protein